MNDTPNSFRVEVCSFGLSADGQAVAMTLSGGAQEPVRLEFPEWIVHQLMRVLPHLDAAIQQRHTGQARSLVAYPVAAWNVEPVGAGMGVAMHLRTDREVDAAYHLSPQDAAALHQALGEAIALDARPSPAAATVN